MAALTVFSIFFVMMVLIQTTNGYSRNIWTVTKRAVLGDSFTVKVTLHHPSYFTESVLFRKKVSASTSTPSNICSFSLDSTPTRNGATGYACSCRLFSSATLRNYTYEITVTKTSITVADRWIWNFYFTSDRTESNVQITPISAPRVDVSHILVSARKGSDVVLRVTFRNTSDVTIRWSRQGHLVTNQNPSVEIQERTLRVYGKNVTSQGVMTRLHVAVDDETLGLYEVTSCSDGGCAASTVMLREMSPIEPPRNFRVAAHVIGGILFVWESGHDESQSDSPQETFSLSFKMSGTGANDSWNYRVVEDSCSGLPVYYLLKNLQLNMQYDVRVQSATTVGGSVYRSSFTDIKEIKVEDSESSSGPGLGAGVGVGVGLIVAVLVGAYIVFKVVKCKRSTLQRSQRDTVRQTQEPAQCKTSTNDYVSPVGGKTQVTKAKNLKHPHHDHPHGTKTNLGRIMINSGIDVAAVPMKNWRSMRTIDPSYIKSFIYDLIS